jgi:hypothetical protein
MRLKARLREQWCVFVLTLPTMAFWAVFVLFLR